MKPHEILHFINWLDVSVKGARNKHRKKIPDQCILPWEQHCYAIKHGTEDWKFAQDNYLGNTARCRRKLEQVYLNACSSSAHSLVVCYYSLSTYLLIVLLRLLFQVLFIMTKKQWLFDCIHAVYIYKKRALDPCQVSVSCPVCLL